MTEVLDAGFARTGRGRALLWAAAAGLVLLGLAYMLRVVVSAGPSKDFAYFWIAGRIWLDGGNPYDPGFSDAANAMAASLPALEGLGGFHRWLYAPHIWAPTAGLASLGYDTARFLWGALSAVLVILGTWLTLAAVLEVRGRAFPLAFGGAAAAASVTMGTAASLDTGQFAAVVYAAIAAFAYGVIRRDRAAVVVALVLLTLKPSVALPFVGIALVVPALRVPLVVAGVVSAILAVPALLTAAPGEIISGYLDGLAAYGHFESNSALSATGLRNLGVHLFEAELSGLGLALIATLIAALIARASLRGGRWPDPDLAAPALAAAISVMLLFVPLHTYDMTLVMVLLILAASGPAFLVVIAALVLLFRANRVSDLLGLVEEGTKFPGSLFSSLVLFTLCMAMLGFFLFRRGRIRPD